MSFIRTTTYETITCPSQGCGVQFAITASFASLRRDDQRSFRCPWGHTMSYGENDLDRERKRTTRLQAQLDQAKAEVRTQRESRQSADRSAAAYKGHLTRIKNRIAAGVCPCCRRPFAAVMRHMRGQHPEFAAKWGLQR